MDHPLLPIEHRCECCAELIAVVLRGEQERACTLPADLHEEGAVIKTVGRGAFGVDGKRPGARS